MASCFLGESSGKKEKRKRQKEREREGNGCWIWMCTGPPERQRRLQPLFFSPASPTPGKKGGWESVPSGGHICWKTISHVSQLMHQKGTNTPLSLGLENPLKMLREFNISQLKVLLEKGNREGGKHFPVSFLVLTNQDCSSGECFAFFSAVYSQNLFSVAQRPSFLQNQAENLLTWDSCLFLIFFTVISLENTKKQNFKEIKTIYIPSSQRQTSRLLLLSYMLMKFGNMSYILLSHLTICHKPSWTFLLKRNCFCFLITK